MKIYFAYSYSEFVFYFSKNFLMNGVIKKNFVLEKRDDHSFIETIPIPACILKAKRDKHGKIINFIIEAINETAILTLGKHEKKFFDRIFIIFQRINSREKYKGTGISVAICKRIMEKRRGKIWINSEIHKSSTFYFTVPGRNNNVNNINPLKVLKVFGLQL